MILLEPLMQELYRIFDYYNEHYYEGKLKTPVITIQVDATRRNAMSWCTVSEVWSALAAEHKYYELNLCPEYLTEPIEVIVSSILHEMVHLYCIGRGIKDTSRAGAYHNKKFRDVAENKGLEVMKDKTHGWLVVGLSQSLNDRRLLEELNVDTSLFYLSRKTFANVYAENPEEEKEKKKSYVRKYVCPICEITVRATKDVYVICGNCKADMLLEEKENDDEEELQEE